MSQPVVAGSIPALLTIYDMLMPLPKGLVLVTEYGLANKLLAIASAIRIGDKFERPVSVIWPVCPTHCPVPFREIVDCPEVTQAHPGIKTNNCIQQQHHIKGGDVVNVAKFSNHKVLSLKFDSEIFLPEDNREHTDFSPYFDRMKPYPDVIERALAFWKANNEFQDTIGVHVRKGDKRTSNKQAEKFLKEFDQRYDQILRTLVWKFPKTRFFISSDEPIDELMAIVGDRGFYFPKEHAPLQRKLPNLQEAFIDMILLSKTKMVVYGVGTFGYCGAVMSNTNRINILNGSRSIILYPDSSPKATNTSVIDKIIQQLNI